MGAWGARSITLFVAAVALSSAWPVASAIFHDTPVAHETVTLGPGWSTLRFASSADSLTFEVEVAGEGTSMLRIDVADANDALLASAEALLQGADARATVRVGSDVVDVSYHPSSHGGFSGRGGGLVSDCVEWYFVGGTFYPDGSRTLRFGIIMLPECAASAMSAALVAAGSDVESSAFRLRSEGIVDVTAERTGGGVRLVPVGAFAAVATLEASAEFRNVFATTGATHAATLAEGWIGSFGLGGGDGTIRLTATSPSGQARACPCYFAGGEEDGTWTFDVSVGASTDPPYLFLAQVERA